MDNLGGMQRVAIDLHDTLLSHRGAEVRPLVLRSPWSQRHWRTPLFLGSAYREIRLLAEEGAIDAVLFSSMVTASLAVPLSKHLRKRGVIMAAIANGQDATTPTWPYPWFVRKVFESLDLVLPISRATAMACKARGLSDEKCEVVLLGIRLDRFPAPTDKAQAREKLIELAGASSSAPKLIIVSVGRLVPRKGVAWFTENVVPLLPADIHYYVAGDGPDRGRIEAAIERHKLGERVKLLGAISDSQLEQLYRGADLFAMPNVHVPGDMEGFGLVMLEAGLCGVPVIAANIEGIADVVTEGESGHLAVSENAASFRDAIMKYSERPDLLSEASSRARLHTASRFGWAGVTDRYLATLRSRIPK
jgi:phosphatidylinositol alpha-1,6-mannosyltransferase